MKNCITICILWWMIRVALLLDEKSDEPIYTYDIDSVPLERCDDKSYRCHDGSCIAEQYYCNGMLDCIGGEDEEKCETCPYSFCSCPDGLCTGNFRSCDIPTNCNNINEDKNDCEDKNDEVLNFYTDQKRCIFDSSDRYLTILNCSEMELVAAPCFRNGSINLEIDVLILNNNKLGLFNGLSQPYFGNHHYRLLSILELDNNKIKDSSNLVIEGMRNLKELSLADNQIRYLDEKGFPETLQNLKKLNLEKNKIKHFSLKVFQNLIKLRNLSLANNEIEYLNMTFKNQEKLEFLNLTRNSIMMLAPDIFSSLVNLKSLDLSHNKIEIIPNQTFCQLKNLTELYLDSNKITKLEQNMFSTLENLRELRLQHNRIGIIENNNAFIGLHELRILNISYNYLTQLVPETFQNLSKIETLNLSNNNIVNIHEDTFKTLLALQKLYINNNRITITPHVISLGILIDVSENEIEVISNQSFSTLTVNYLYLNHNKLKTLKSEMFSKALFSTVDLSNNQISIIEKRTFSGMKRKDKKIFTLYMNFNNLTKLTSGMFEGVIDLNSLEMTNNKINAIEDNVFQPLNQLIILDLSFNALSAVTSNMFRGLKAVWHLCLQNNEIKSIESNSFRENERLILLDLSNNSLTEVPANMFLDSCVLSKLYLQNNKIKNIQMNVFNNCITLLKLNLSNNQLSTISSNTFHGLSGLKSLYLQENKIEKIEMNAFECPKLDLLNLSNNQLSTINSNTFQHLRNLEYLYLQENKIEKIEMNAFECPKLNVLNLSSNMLTELKTNVFNGLPILRTLYLQRNKMKYIEEGVFKNTRLLKTLNLKNNTIGEIEPNLLKRVRRLDLLIADEYRFCCLKNNTVKCEPPPDEFSSCEDLMKNTLLRMFVWILGVVAVFANSFVIIFRMRYQSVNTNEVNSFLIKNLAMSDLLLGVYLLIIASMDAIFRGEYYLHDFNWRQSFWCNLAGFLSTFSSELTVFILTVLSIDRLYAIKFPYRAKQRGTSRIKKLMIIVWVLAAIIAMIPLPFVNIDYFRDFYGRSGVCLPLHITTHTPSGWEYSVFVFIILNATSFTVIAINYILMYQTAIQTRRSISSSNEATGSVMAFRMTLLVLADAACWIPIIALGIRSMMGETLSPDVYPWIAVFVLPLNAALNPILYTISSIPMVIKVKFANTRLNGRLVLKFRWPCTFHWVAANEPRKPDKNIRTTEI